MCSPIFQSGKVVVLDSGFCVLKGLILLASCGVFAAAQIKKRRYWPWGVPGEEIKRKMEDSPIGSMTCIRGSHDDVPYSIFNLKEPDYISSQMATYGCMMQNGKETSRETRDEDGEKITEHAFKYNDTFDNHFTYRHIVDDHNNLRHQVPSIEMTWQTRRWENRVFAFLLAVTEVNVYKAMLYFVYPLLTTKPTDLP